MTPHSPLCAKVTLAKINPQGRFRSSTGCPSGQTLRIYFSNLASPLPNENGVVRRRLFSCTYFRDPLENKSYSIKKHSSELCANCVRINNERVVLIGATLFFGVISKRLERLTDSLEGCCSIQLSYETGIFGLQRYAKKCNGQNVARGRRIGVQRTHATSLRLGRASRLPLLSFAASVRTSGSILLPHTTKRWEDIMPSHLFVAGGGLEPPTFGL